MHDAAKGFVGTFFTHMVEQMFQESHESNEDGFEAELYSSFLSEAMAEKIAGAGSSRHMVTQVENKLRRQSGLQELPLARKVYETMGALTNQKEAYHVRTTTA